MKAIFQDIIDDHESQELGGSALASEAISYPTEASSFHKVWFNPDPKEQSGW